MVRFIIAFIACAIIVSCYGKSIKFVDRSTEIQGEDKLHMPAKMSTESKQDTFDSMSLKAYSPPSKTSQSSETPELPPLHRPIFDELKISENSDDPFETTA
uniref:Uncharacterized protein n=1 Tax=Panagrolaimus sp. PS1159 TaxID=55785 RepID=A0AC35GN11_9BILA